MTFTSPYASFVITYQKSISNWSEIVYINFNKFVVLINSNKCFPAVTMKDILVLVSKLILAYNLYTVGVIPLENFNN